MGLFNKKKEPTIQDGLKALDKMCDTNKYVLYSQILNELAKHEKGITIKDLIKNSLDFVSEDDKKIKELYFTAARGVLHKMVFRGTAFIMGHNSPSPQHVVITEKGKLEYGKSQLRNQKRKGKEKDVEVPAELIESLVR